MALILLFLLLLQQAVEAVVVALQIPHLERLVVLEAVRRELLAALLLELELLVKEIMVVRVAVVEAVRRLVVVVVHLR
jgi:hypothetical protein